tara:strand:+ start:228 stop:494 length:267 start_codon:yes stop_codon:yes gene_type:complete
MTGQVSLTYKIMLDSSIEELDPEAICEEIKHLHGVNDAVTKPLAFGMKFIQASCTIDDGEGKVDQLEESLKNIVGVGELEVLEMGRLM